MITPKAVSQKGLKDTTTRDWKKYQSAWFKESAHFYDVSMICFLVIICHIKLILSICFLLALQFCLYLVCKLHCLTFLSWFSFSASYHSHTCRLKINTHILCTSEEDTIYFYQHINSIQCSSIVIGVQKSQDTCQVDLKEKDKSLHGSLFQLGFIISPATKIN